MNYPLKALSSDDFTVDVKVYPIKEVSSENTTGTEQYGTIGTDIGQDADYIITFPDESNIEAGISKEVYNSLDYASDITFTCPEQAATYNYEEVDSEEGTIIKINSAKTYLLQPLRHSDTQVTMMFKKILKVVYVNTDGTETIMWEE